MAENDTHYNEPVFEPSMNQETVPETSNPEGAGNQTGTEPVVPLPTPEMSTPAFPGNESGAEPMIPLPTPEMSTPVYPGNDMNMEWFPTTPSFPGMPIFPSTPSVPSTPSFPSFPSYPNLTPQNFGQVRFLNSSANSFPVSFLIDQNVYAANSRFGTISSYDWVSDGFHTVTVRRASGTRPILLQQNFPFIAGQKVTIVLVDSASGGLEFVMVSDTGCNNLPYNSGCYRFANMTYSGSRFDLLLYGGETVFRNVVFQTVTSYKQAVSATYQFYITRSNTYTFLRELPIIVIGAIGTTSNVSQPLVSFTVDIQAGRNYTSYLIGNTWSDLGLRVITVED